MTAVVLVEERATQGVPPLCRSRQSCVGHACAFITDVRRLPQRRTESPFNLPWRSPSPCSELDALGGAGAACRDETGLMEIPA